jgi:hypothetical protein
VVTRLRVFVFAADVEEAGMVADAYANDRAGRERLLFPSDAREVTDTATYAEIFNLALRWAPGTPLLDLMGREWTRRGIE